MSFPNVTNKNVQHLLSAIVLSASIVLPATGQSLHFISVDYSFASIEEVTGCCISALVTGNAWTGRTYDSMGNTVTTFGSVPELSEDVHLDALAMASGALYFSVDQTVVLGGLSVRPADVMQRDPGGTFSRVFDATAAGIPDGVNLDAFTFVDSPLSAATMAVSFDTTVVMTGDDGAPFITLVDDEDLVFTDAVPFFDGTASGIPHGADLNGAHHIAETGQLLLTFDVGLAVGGSFAVDEYSLLYDLDTGVWELGPLASSSTDNDVEGLMATVEIILFNDGFESGNVSAWSSAAP